MGCVPSGERRVVVADLERQALVALLTELLDEHVPAGELSRIVRSVRQTVRENAAGFERDPPDGLEVLAETFARELCEGPGLYPVTGLASVARQAVLETATAEVQTYDMCLLDDVLAALRRVLAQLSGIVERDATRDAEALTVLILRVRQARLHLGHLKVEPAVFWRGSVLDLVTDLKALLTPEQLHELACETALVAREAKR